MNTEFSAFDLDRPLGEHATHPLTHLGARIPLSLLVAGPGLPPRRFAASTRPNAPSGASNYGFQV
ncbi:hypothetical protein [Sulfuriferula multivorans]|uniref:hypothetical protein n=1 Tax=Sulfuriferula multivorans TaxID=1559896 RepID=UPI000F5BD366|nr:hypothetical protein [Sulfuriferula multivorans]